MIKQYLSRQVLLKRMFLQRVLDFEVSTYFFFRAVSDSSSALYAGISKASGQRGLLRPFAPTEFSCLVTAKMGNWITISALPS